MKQNTAMQELIDIIDKRIEAALSFSHVTAISKSFDDIKWGFQTIKRHATELLKKEEEQIKKSAEWGINEANNRILHRLHIDYHELKTPHEYFNQTYNNK